MKERISELEVAYDVQKQLTGISPLVAVLGWSGSNILLGRENQRWIMTIKEIPEEHARTR